ncbi:MAG: NUDIX domain-containing protein [Clostridia bacterium]|nr:NUDIX domain-containing protein [Clostridia bacterium]
MDELVEHIDEFGNVLGVVSRWQAHKQGLLHRVVHICIVNSKNQILLQKRSKKKRLYPSVWDISAAGHILAGEKSLTSAIREVREELGLDLQEDEFEFLFAFLDDLSIDDFYVNEIADVYLVKKDVNIDDIKTQKNEVDEVKWVPVDEFCRDCLGDNFCPHKKGFKKLREFFKNIKNI